MYSTLSQSFGKRILQIIEKGFSILSNSVCEEYIPIMSTATAARTSRRSNSHDDNLSYLKDAYSLQRTVSSPTAKQVGSSKRLQTIESGIALNEKADNNDSIMSSSDKLLVDHHVSEEASSSSPDSHQELFELQVSSSSQSSSPVLYNSYNTGGGGERNSPSSAANNLPPLHPNAPPPPSLDLSTPKVNGSSNHHQTKHIYNPSSTS